MSGVEIAKIEGLIYIVRGHQVMLDLDLAAIYEVDVAQLKRQVRRNLARFPGDFMLTLTPAEYESLRCQFGILKRGQHSKYMPFAFTEQGVAMLSSVLRSPRAVQANVEIMRAFVRMRRVLVANRDLAARMEAVEKRLGLHEEALGEQGRAIRAVFDEIRRLMGPPDGPRRRIGF